MINFKSMSEISSEKFVRIKSKHLLIKEELGRGTFGQVKKCFWNDQKMAIKIYQTPEQKKSFRKELDQLSKVSHKNIIRLYGYVEEKDLVAMVMDYADKGSLYNVLYQQIDVRYNLWDVISWALQCARGLSYMHGMQPKMLIHRDIKSLNLLLLNGGKYLKICDFGTVCDLKSEMTCTRGSLPWMAPEVFMSNKYTEKCDVFSLGILLWELLARAIPWSNINNSHAIMLAVGDGKRLPLFENCPKIIEIQMTRCWSQDPGKRPSMKEMELTFERILNYCPKPKFENIFQSFNCIKEMKSNTNQDLRQTHSPEYIDSVSDSLCLSQKEGTEGWVYNIQIPSTEPIPTDFDEFETIISKLPKLIIPEKNDLKSTKIFERHRNIFKKFQINKSEEIVLSSYIQELQNFNENIDNKNVVKCLKEEKQSLENLKINLRKQLDKIKANSYGFELIDDNF